MGLLKKITKPLSKFLDKIVPNEIKPALPYLAAFAPFMMGPGAAGSSGFWNSMTGRAIMAGGANLGSQLAQEGSEGEFDELSLALASGIGALSAPGAPGKAMGVDKFDNIIYQPGQASAAEFLKTKAAGMDPGLMRSGTEMLGKGSQFLINQGDILRPEGAPLTMKNVLTAGSVPITQGTGDLARITAEQALRDYENELANSDDPSGANDEGRRRAIRAAMEAGGHLEETILDALASLGLRSGGIVSLNQGGRVGLQYGGGTTITLPGGKKYTSSVTPGEFQDIAHRTVVGGGGKFGGDPRQVIEDYTKNYLAQNQRHTGNQGGLGGLYLKDRGGYTLTGGPGAKPNFANIYAGYLNNPKETMGYRRSPVNIKDRIRAQAVFDTFSPGGGRMPLPGPIGAAGSFSPENYLNTQGMMDAWYQLGMQQSERENPGSTVRDSRGWFDPAPTPERRGMMINGKEYFSEQEAIDDMGIVRYNQLMAKGGRISKEGGGVASVLPKGREADYRGGGVIPVGSRERADDVPARLSKNEFVMTADAVRAAGGGSINKGAKRMYNLMHNLEARV